MTVDMAERASSARTQPEHTAEFDQFAAGYNAGMDNFVKHLAASGADDFAEIRAEWLVHYVKAIGNGAGTSLLDFGCGSATFLKALRRARYGGTLAGCDVSNGMLEEARRTWTEGAPPHLSLQPHDRLPYPLQCFDLAVAIAVFHHIPPAERGRWYGELYRVLRPGGRCIIFEHNPWNPVTRWVVSRTPIDANAVLLSQREAGAALRDAGFETISTSSIIFFPPRFKFFRPWERRLAWLPLGGQYVAVGRRPLA